MRTFQIIIPVIVAGLTVSCSKDLMTPLDSSKIAVVESYIYAGDSVLKVKVSKLLPISDDTIDLNESVSGLNLLVNGKSLTETDPGTYELSLGSQRIKPGESYSVKFLYFSDTVSAVTTIPQKPSGFTSSATTLYTSRITSTSGYPSGQMAEAELSWDNPDESYYYLTVQYLDSVPDYINYKMADLDLPVKLSEPPTQTAGMRIGMRNLNFFGSYRLVLFKVNSDFTRLYEHVTSNSNNITNPVTTLSNGYGVFTGMSTDTIYLQVREN